MLEKAADPPRILLTLPEAARTLSLSERMVWSLSEPRGRLPVVKIGRARRYLRTDIEAWAASQKEGQR